MPRSFSNSRFFSQDWFREEQEKIFKKHWIFFCLKKMVEKVDSFVTRDMFGVPVVVQNFNGRIAAFQNVCLHRQNKIHYEDFGVRAFVCRYHGWKYGFDGRIERIPFNSSYFKVDDVCSPKLIEFAVAIIGDFVFVNLDKDPLPIEEQFSESVRTHLSSISKHFDNEILIAHFSFKYNWKLIYENLRDSLHPQFLHTTTITRDVEILPTVNSRPESSNVVPTLESMSFGGRVHELKSASPPAFGDKVERWGHDHAYFNWLLFPNTHIVSPDGGFSFSIEHHIPVGPDRTEIIVYVMTAKRTARIPTSVLHETIKKAKKILDEDNFTMEKIQSVIPYGPSFPILAAGESEIEEFELFVTSLVGDFDAK